MSGDTLAYVELAAASHFSFLHGASHGADLVGRALDLGHAGLGVADRNTVAGVVRAWQALKRARESAPDDKRARDFKLVTGARLVFADGTPDILAYPETRAGWGRLCRLLSTGNLRADKGDCVLRLDDLLAHLDGLLLIVLADSTRREDEGRARKAEDQTRLPDDDASGFFPEVPGVTSSVIPILSAATRASPSVIPAPPSVIPAQAGIHCGDGRRGSAGEGGMGSCLRGNEEGGGQSHPCSCESRSPDPQALPLDGPGLLPPQEHRSCDDRAGTGLSGDNVIAFPGRGRGMNREVAQAGNIRLFHTLDILRVAAPARVWLGVAMRQAGPDRRRLARLAALARQAQVPLLAVNDVLYAAPEDRPLQDVLTAIRLGCTLMDAGLRLEANAERHLKSPAEMARLFVDAPEAIAEALAFHDRIRFDLGELGYEYPHEPVPEGWRPMRWLQHLVIAAARKRWPDGSSRQLRDMLREEFRLIRQNNYAYYFLTVHDVVHFARTQEPPILCQGRGSAANSMVCYLLGITSVDPAQHNLLFSRFISDERKEPPDIDVDFEHERREEVMQYIYRRYGRHRAGIVATVIHYRPRSAVREVGKALGLTDDVTSRLVSTVWGSFSTEMEVERYHETGFSLDNPEIERLNHFVGLLVRAPFPRHLSQHVGGFVLTDNRLDETVPIHHAAMEDRTFIEWDKDDIDALGLMKVDVLALGMLTCIRKAFDLIRADGGPDYTLDDLPSEQPDVYDMLCTGDSIGVFQVESRAQINMLPRLRPRELYDLVVQVAIVRPGPIQGDMVHPYLRRRAGLEKTEFPSPHPDHGPPGELQGLLGRTFGVPLFQEQAMKLAIVAAKFTSVEANQLRRAMATFRHVGGMDNFREKLVGGMMRRGYAQDFAERCYQQIEGFGSYGFPESHAQSFARLVYVSAFIKCRYPAAFCAALLNSQPMGFYAPAQLVRDAREHGVEVLPVDVSYSGWDSSLEGGVVRLGLRQVDGFREEWAKLLPGTGRGTARVASGGGGVRLSESGAAIPLHQPAAGPPPRAGEELDGLARRLPPRALRILADADAFRSLGLDRRQALWAVRRMQGQGTLPLFAAADAPEFGEEADPALPAMPLSEHVAADYQTTRLSLKDHPMSFLRPLFRGEGVLSAGEMARRRDGARAKVAGVVLVRQRPGGGKAIFITLEDETGVVNVLLWARDFEKYRRQVMAARLMEVHGIVQKSAEGVFHLMGAHVFDRSAELGRLSEDHHTRTELSRADVFQHPIYTAQGSGGRHHPRDARILPSSRDFH